MDAKALLTMAGIGIVAGWLASFFVGGDGGLIRYLVSGVLGSFVGGYLLSSTGVSLGIKNPLASQIITATIGAVVVLIIANIIS
ncbi:MAG: GlsB/YeaQ/YmgE family stress response membrane protein [Ahrensia sp.]